MKTKLTIAIPTYNRVQKLEEAINNLLRIVGERSVEIIVSDNASTDGTDVFMHKIIKDYKNIVYFRNEQNLGYAGNFINCFNNAKGEYVWLLSDDDIITDFAIESVFECISKNPVIIKLNTRSIDSKRTEIRKGRIIEYNDREQFYKQIGIMSTFISCIVFNNKVIQTIDKEKYRNDALIVGYVLETLKNDGLYLLNESCCVLSNPNEKVRYDVYRVWVYQYPHDMLNIGLQSGFSKDFLIQQIRYDLDNTIFNFVIKFKRTCDTSEWKEDFVWKYVSFFPELIPWYQAAVRSPIATLWIIGIIHKLFRKAKRLKNEL